MFQALFNSLSGLFSFSRALDTVSNNVANMNTPGFRGSDSFFENVGSEFGTQMVGKGIRTTPGLPSSTGSPTDLEIKGNGYFVLRDASGNLYYTRAGQFTFNDKGVLIDTVNHYDVMSIDASGNLSTIDKTPFLTLPGQPTTTVNLIGSIVRGTAATTTTPYQRAADFTSSVQIFDTTGAPHTLTLKFQDTSLGTLGDNSSTFEVTLIDGSKQVDLGSISFDSNGAAPFGSTNTITANLSYLGVSQAVALNFGSGFNSSNATIAVEPIAGGNNTSSITGTATDGRAPLAGTFAFDINGILQVAYSASDTKQGPQIALASFSSDDALQMIGGRLVAASSAQQRVLGHPGTGAFGTITGNSLELSNVDLTQEFAQMIIIQRGYQASSKVMTVSNQMIEQLYNGQSGG